MASLALLAGCAAQTSSTLDEPAPVIDASTAVAGGGVANTVLPIVARQFTGVPSGTATRCMLDNASERELSELANASSLDPSKETVDLVVKILRRRETLSCIDEASALRPLVGGTAAAPGGVSAIEGRL